MDWKRLGVAAGLLVGSIAILAGLVATMVLAPWLWVAIGGALCVFLLVGLAWLLAGDLVAWWRGR